VKTAEQKAKHNKYMREYRATHPEYREYIVQYNKKNWKKYQPKTIEARIKRSEIRERYRTKYPERRKAGSAVWWAVKTGKLIKQPCEVCGKKKVQAHHSDYQQRLLVVWLCHNHHIQLHMKEK